MTGFDISDVGVKLAKADADKRGLKIHAQVGDVDKFDYGKERYDLVVGLYMHEYLNRNAAKVIASLKPGGILVVASPGKLSWGHSGVGTAPHLSVANLAYRSGIDTPVIPYRGEASMFVDLIAGRVHFGSPSVALAVGQKVRVLAVFADSRHPAFPEAPTFTELGMPSMPPGFNGLFAPKGTPKEVLAVLERACERAVQTESFRSTAQRLSQKIAYLNGAAFAERAASDYRYKGEIIKALDIKVE